MSHEQTYPQAFVDRLQAQLEGEFNEFIEALNGISPTSVRVNPYKTTGRFANEENIAWCSNGKYLQERPSFTFDALFHAGAYYVQEASSMFLEEVWKQLGLANKT